MSTKAMRNHSLEIIFDMETRDPDDFFALCFLLSHPDVHLILVTANPGSAEQVALIREVLSRCDANGIPVGSRNSKSNPNAVSEFHYDVLGKTGRAEPDGIAHELLAGAFEAHPKATFLTGAPLHNGRLLLNNHPTLQIQRWVGQGGFAGDNVVPPKQRLDKFASLETCVTRNLSADGKSARMMLASSQILRKELVSKNVCHGVSYDQQMHKRLCEVGLGRAGVRLIYQGMGCYLRQHPEGKMFHDPLAACVAVNPEIVTFAEVEMYEVSGAWEARSAKDTNTFITTAVDQERFIDTLVHH